MPNSAKPLANVTVTPKANVYFDGKVVSHTVITSDGERKTLGLIYPGSYRFNTAAPERMEITSGECRAHVDGEPAGSEFKAGSYFDVPGKAGFTIEVRSGICEYICSFR